MLIIEGILLGVNNGLAPEILSSWVICEALKGNTKAFIKISLAPITFGLIIVPLIFAFVTLLHNNPVIIGSIAIAGSAFLIYMGINQICTVKNGVKNEKDSTENSTAPKKAIFLKSSLLNFCNPYGYVFWLSIGIPLVNKAAHIGFAFAGIVIATYYLSLVLSTMCLGIFVQFFNRLFKMKFYKQITRFMGIIFVFFGIYYAHYALHLLLASN